MQINLQFSEREYLRNEVSEFESTFEHSSEVRLIHKKHKLLRFYSFFYIEMSNFAQLFALSALFIYLDVLKQDERNYKNPSIG